MKRFEAIVGATMIVLAAGAATPARGENVVRWASASGMPTWDPHGYRWGFDGYRQVYESLVMHDAAMTLVPALAVSWQLIDPTTWRFTLRQGVTFHHGTPLTAEDVVFSIERARGAGSDFKIPDRAGTIASARVVDPNTVEVTTTQPDPELQVKIRLVNILSKSWAERHGVTAATYYVDDHGTYVLDHANGTGPFILDSFDPGSKRAVLVRNPNWWGLEQYQHNIDRIEWTVIADPEARLRALLDGEIDFLRDVPPEGLARIRATAGLKLLQTADLNPVALFFNQARGAPADADVAWSKPLRDRRVREAIYRAIDAQALCDGVLQGLGSPAGSLSVPGMPGYSPDLDQRLPYDPARAKALLAEAGYGAGFDLQLDCKRNRKSACGDVARQLANVGIRVALSIVPDDVVDSKDRDRTLRSTLYGYGNYDTFGDIDNLRYFYSKEGGGVEGYSYANAKFDALFEQIDRAEVTYARDALVEEAWRMILQEDIAVVPLYRNVVVWAMRENLDLPISPADTVYFREARLDQAGAEQGPATGAAKLAGPAAKAATKH